MDHQLLPLATEDKILNKIYFIRGFKVMFDFDLAVMYLVETKQLKRQVRRYIERFPIDFMFELNKQEYDSLRSQFGTLKRGEHSNICPWPLQNKELPCYQVY